MELAKKTEPAKVVVWGIGEDYDNVYNSIELQILKNNIEIVASCSSEVDKISPTFEEKPLITKNKLCKFTFDYIIIANKGSFYSIQKEAYERMLHFGIFIFHIAIVYNIYANTLQ